MIALTTDGLMRVFRREVHDLAAYDAADGSTSPDEHTLWKDDEIYQYMTEGVDAVARLTQGNYKIVRLPVVAGDAVVRLPRAVLHIRNAQLLNADRPITPLNTNQAQSLPRDDYGLSLTTNALFGSSGTPDFYVRDYERCALRLAPTPNAADTLELQVTATTAIPMLAGMPLPFDQAVDQRLVLHKMKELAYEKQDAETEDLVRAKYFGAKFENEAMDRKSEVRNQRRGPEQVRFSWS